MFRTVSITGFIVTFVGIAICCIAFPCHQGCRWSPVEILRRIFRLFTFLLLKWKLTPLGVLRKLVYILALFCLVVLAVTGFYPTLVLDKHLSGYLLMLHATFAPVFAICLAILSVLWAHNCRFTPNDWPWLQRVIQRITLGESRDEEAHCESSGVGQKIVFWLIVILAPPLILSIVLSMFPLFGTEGQEFLVDAHRWTALAFALVAIIHTYLMIRTKMKQC